MSKPLIASLLRLSTCEVSDALIKLGHATGGHLPGIEAFSPSTPHVVSKDGTTQVPRVCGPAFTVKMVATSDSSAPKPAEHFVDAVATHAEEGCVMVVSAPSNTRSAIWGGLMTARAQSLGVSAVILDGRCRDLSEHRSAAFPVFARGHSTLGQSPFTRPSELNCVLEICDPTLGSASSGGEGEDKRNPPFPPTTVNPRDLILADEDGVVVIPPSMAQDVIDLAQKGRGVDEKCMQDLKKGRSIKETFAEHRGK